MINTVAAGRGAGSIRPTALLLGNGGFIGQHLGRQIDQGMAFASVETAGLRSSEFPLKRSSTHFNGRIDGNLLARCARPDAVFWAIGGASVSASIQDAATDRALSIPPLECLLERLSTDWRGVHLVFLSSAAIYGASGSASTRRDSPLLPVSPYGETKLASERLIEETLAAGTYTLVRPFSVYGPGLRRQLLWDALQKLSRGNREFFGTGEELRDWVYVEDLARLLVDIGARPGEFPALLNAGTGVGVSVRQVLLALFEVAGATGSPAFAGTARAGDPDRLVACLQEQEALQHYFRMPLHDGLRAFVAWQADLPLG